jgi:hypothetical protein
MADRDFKINIVTQGDASGAKDAGQALEDTGQKAEKANAHHREMHRLMHALNEVVPGLGYAMKVAFNPATIGLVGTLFAVQQLVKWIEEYKHHLAEAREHAAALETGTWEAQEEKARNAAVAAREYADALKSVGDKVDDLKGKEDKELGVLKAIEEARRKILDAQEKAELAKAGGDAVQEAAIRARYGEKKTAEQLAGEQAEIDQKAGFLKQEQARAAAAKSDLEAAEKAKEAGAPGGIAAARAKVDLTYDQKALEDARKAAQAAGNPEELRQQLAGTKNTIFDSFAVQKAEEKLKAAEAAQQKLKEAEAAVHADNEAINRHKDATDKLAEAEKKALDRFSAAQGAVTARQAELDKDRAVHGINTQAAQRIQGIEDDTILQQAGYRPGDRQGRDFLRDIRGEESRAAGQGMTEEQLKGNKALDLWLKQHGQNEAQRTELFNMLMSHALTEAQKLEALRQRVARLSAQSGSGGSLNFQ